MAQKSAPSASLPQPPAVADSGARDLVLVVAGRKDGSELTILRSRGDELEAGVMRSVQEGKPIHGELVELRQRSEHPLLFDARSVELPAAATLHKSAASAAAAPPAAPAKTSPLRKGPAQVATENYRTNWERIFAASDGGKLTN